MTARMSHTYRLFRNFLFSWWNKEFLIFLFFLALSSIFWLMMTLNETTEQEVKVPVKLLGIPENVVITTDMADTVRVTVRDKGYALAAYIYGERVRQVKVNFRSTANKQTGYGYLSPAELQKLVAQSFGGSSKVVSVKPDRLEYYFNYGLSKKVPVHFNGAVTPGKLFYLARMQLQPDSVTVYASEEKLDSIKFVETEPIHITNLCDTVVREVSLVTSKGMKLVPASIKIGLYPDVLTEESAEVPITVINQPEGKSLRTFPSRVVVRFSIGASMFRKINTSLFSVVADYRDIAAHPNQTKCNLYIRTMPHGVRNAQLSVQQVDYLIEEQ